MQKHFSKYEIRYTQTYVEHLVGSSRQEKESLKVDKRARRNSKENKSQLLEKYYFPKISDILNKIIQQCKIYSEGKYDRHPNKSNISHTPLPKYAREILRIDVWSIEKHFTLTSIDKLTKYAQASVINSRSIADIREPIRKIVFSLSFPE